MILFSKKVGSKYAIDFAFFHKVRDFKDGITFINFNTELDLYEEDHNPKARFYICLFNFTMIDICFYNINHLSSSSEIEAV